METKLYQVVLETMQDGLLMLDTKGIILGANPAFLDMTGFTGAELIGKRCTILNCSGCKIFGEESETGFWCKMFEKGSLRGRRCEILAKDGRTIHVVKSATVLHDEHGRVVSAVETMQDISELVRKEERINSLRIGLQQGEGFFGIVGSSAPMRRLFDLIENVGLSDAPVMIHGESGVGKELVARAVHESGVRSGGNYIKVNCASLNENLLESELFGHVKGAFTGADRNRVGRFEAASGGSIFLDEIGEISSSTQVKLLRVLESREIERVGDHRPVFVDTRVISATNRNIEELVGQGGFRSDLFYRINVIPIHVPPLRERKEDIPMLAQTFIKSIATRSGKPIGGLNRDALETLFHYDWPGNVRELRNVIEYAFVLCREGVIGPEHLAPRILSPQPNNHKTSVLRGQAKVINISVELARAERESVCNALRSCGGSRTEAARLLGMSRVTLWKKMKKHGILCDERKHQDEP